MMEYINPILDVIVNQLQDPLMALIKIGITALITFVFGMIKNQKDIQKLTFAKGLIDTVEVFIIRRVEEVLHAKTLKLKARKNDPDDPYTAQDFYKDMVGTPGEIIDDLCNSYPQLEKQFAGTRKEFVEYLKNKIEGQLELLKKKLLPSN